GAAAEVLAVGPPDHAGARVQDGAALGTEGGILVEPGELDVHQLALGGGQPGVVEVGHGPAGLGHGAVHALLGRAGGGGQDLIHLVGDVGPQLIGGAHVVAAGVRGAAP